MVKAADSAHIPLARPVLEESEIHAAERVLRSGRVVLGPENRRFEERLATLTGRGHAICVTSGTTALELALWALHHDHGRTLAASATDPTPEVLVPVAGFPAAPNAILRLGAMPVAVDVSPDTWTMDLEQAAGLVGDATRALVSVDTLGVVAEVEPLVALCEERGLVLVDDAACSLGGFDSGGRAGGSYGALGTLSFHPRKVITTGEGGAVVCDDDRLADRLRELRNHGQAGRGRFLRAGTNARLPELAAAIGLAQLDRMGTMLGERKLLVSGYKERLGDLRSAGKLSWQEPPASARPAHQTFAVLLAEGIDRARVQAHLGERGIETGVALYALHRLDCHADLPGVGGREFPVAEALHDRGLALPLFVGMRTQQLDRVTDALKDALKEALS